MTISFFILLFIVALLYASVGHGGASGYLALMALYGFAPEMMKPTALILNIIVSCAAFIMFYKEGHIKWSLFLPFAIASVPFSFLGGTILLDAYLYKKILGLVLLLAVIRIFIHRNTKDHEVRPASMPIALLLGAIIGFLSGLMGIGGGILLSPILLMLSWATQKQTAGISALFIFVNSIAGLAGQMTTGLEIEPDMLNYMVVAITGGVTGAWLGSVKFNKRMLSQALSAVLLLASLKLILT
jgi:uncharacterized membrane protein YfcA